MTVKLNTLALLLTVLAAPALAQDYLVKVNGIV